MGRIHRAPPCFTAIDPQNPPKTLRFRSNFKVFVCLTVCNHARTTLSRTGRSSPYIPRIPSHPPGTLLTQKSTPHVLQNTCGVHIYSLTATAGAPSAGISSPQCGFMWIHSREASPSHPPGYPAAELPTRRATGRPPPSRHSPAHQCPQCGCAPSDPASTTDADTATNQPQPGYPSPPGHPAPGS